MRQGSYYSVRTGKNLVGARFDLAMLRRMFVALFADFEHRGYFQELLGYQCVDEGQVAGTAGDDIEAYVLRKLKKVNIWPPSEHRDQYSDDDIFDLLEFMFDHVSKPTAGRYHSYANCGYHYYQFNAEAGRDEFRQAVNEVLRDYQDPYELSSQGEILSLPSSSIAQLLEVSLPVLDPDNVEGRVAAATRKFRIRTASEDDRRDAIRDLADVLEFLRPRLREVLLAKDEQDLFNIVNNFGIRHHNQQQKLQYDKAVWYEWMFYYYLATIQAAVRLLTGSAVNESL